MSRRDTIIVAVLLNIGLLAILFMMATNPEDEHLIYQPDLQKTLVEAAASQQEKKAPPTILSAEKNSDEVDIVLQDFAETIRSNTVEEIGSFYTPSQTQYIAAQSNHEPEPIPSPSISQHQYSSNEQDYVEVTVKSGDILGRIAQSNNTSVSAIKKLNYLQSDNLKVGQVLKIPKNGKVSSPTTFSSVNTPEKSSKFYTIQSGDNPWKIAKKFNLKVQDLLKLNELDEAKARNLRPGDRIRVQ